MSEERLIKRLKGLEGNSLEQAVFYIEDVQGLLVLYKQEKEKNKKLNELQGYNILDIFNMGKESSRQRIKLDWIEKDKIKEKIKENEHKDFIKLQVCYQHDNEARIRVQAYKELLEEK